MRKIILYIASSINGKIAKSDGSVEWLEEIPNPEKDDYGYDEFYKSIDTTIQGYNTYKQIIDWNIEFPYKGKSNYIFSKKQNLKDTKHVKFISVNHIQFTRNLKQQSGKNIWLIGGGQINTLLLNAGLIDEIYLFYMPIVLAGGISIFESEPKENGFNIIDTKTYSTGVVRQRYNII